jgi:molybdenum cofactor cytidylyltransferase
MIIGIVLAGGASSRMGRTKALLPIGSTTFVARVVSTLQQAGCTRVVVVAGAAFEAICADVERRALGVAVVENRAPARGQLSSLQVALRHVGDDVEAAVVALCDHPLVGIDTVRRLIEAWRTSDADVVRPVTGSRHGHPVVFARRVFARLLAADVDAGARVVVRAPDIVRLDVEVDDPGVFVNVDTPDDFARLDDPPAGA